MSRFPINREERGTFFLFSLETKLGENKKVSCLNKAASNFEGP